MNISERKQLIQAGLGDIPLDLKITNVKLVNVYSGEICQTDLGIKNGRIASISAADLKAEKILDGKGDYALPGLIDTHVHIDSTLLTPEHLAEVIVPHGTTAMFVDPMEISNVAGMHGLKALIDKTDRLPYRIYLEVSSRVPTAPGLETTGGELGLIEVSEILTWEQSISLGELDPSKVLGLQDEYLKKIERAEQLGKISNGHTAGLSGKALDGYACGGLSDDHECVDFQDALTRLRLGLSVLIREGSSERNLIPIVTGALEAGIDFSNLMFCTDDKHPTEIVTEGHIDYMVNKAIQLGVPPIKAIQMATINSARHFRIDHLVGSISPGRFADLILSPTLDQIRTERVIQNGNLVAQKYQLIDPQMTRYYPPDLMKSIHISRGSKPEDFRLTASANHVKVWVIGLIRDQIINHRETGTLSVNDGIVQTDSSQDILKLAAVERYGKNGNIGITFVRGFGLKSGAIASSVSHDHHNIVVAGCNDQDMAACVRAVQEMQGGLALADGGEVIGRLALPVAGLMSDHSAAEVIEELKTLNAGYTRLGGVLSAPFMALSFISLPTVPELGLTDKGLIDVETRSIISPILEAMN
jgi:adenine deaminase